MSIPPEGSDSLVKTEAVIYNDVEAPANQAIREYPIYVANELQETADLVTEVWLPSYIYISNMMTVTICDTIRNSFLLLVRVRNIRRRDIMASKA